MTSLKDAPPKVPTPEERIITHMNKLHQDSLIRYLEHHESLSSYAARDAELTQITLKSLTIKASGKEHTIPINPPMDSLMDARFRVIAMDEDSIRRLNRSPITIKEYVPPNVVQSIILAGVLWGFFAFSYQAQYYPGNPLYEALWTHFPTWAESLRKYANLGLVLMVGIHAAEATIMHYKKLKKHSVPTGSAVWWKWIISTFFEGFGCFQRVKRLVKSKQAEMDKHKH